MPELHEPVDAPSSSDVAALKEAFALFDSDNDGVITKEEMSAVLKSLGLNPTMSEIEDMINEVDLDQTGTVDLDGKTSQLFQALRSYFKTDTGSEFIKMMSIKTKPANVEDEMRSAFNVFDKDGSGTISVEELGALMKTFGENLSDEDLKTMIQEVDKNGDGSIDYEEFLNFFLEK
ncbi:calmodulin [Diplocarpon rosae]|nr:calmodulin [Diplocarpon rosae]